MSGNEGSTAWFEGLPEVITRADFGSLVGRPPRGAERMAARGLLAAPAYRNRGKLVWHEAPALAWFRSLQEHAVIVPANARTTADLKEHGAYVCRLGSGAHVGLARPKMLVMYQRGGAGLVFGVDAVETVNQQIDGTRPASARTRAIVRDGERQDTFGTRWTIFHIREAGTIANITPSIKQGRYLRLDDVLDALTTGQLTVPTQDEAFPSRM